MAIVYGYQELLVVIHNNGKLQSLLLNNHECGGRSQEIFDLLRSRFEIDLLTTNKGLPGLQGWSHESLCFDGLLC